MFLHDKKKQMFATSNKTFSKNFPSAKTYFKDSKETYYKNILKPKLLRPSLEILQE